MEIHVGGPQRMNPTDPPAFSSTPQKLDDIHVPKKMTANFFDDQLMLHLAPFTINDQQNYCHFHQRNFVKSASWLMLACYTKMGITLPGEH